MTRFEQALEDLEWHVKLLGIEDRLSSIGMRLDLIEEQVDGIEGRPNNKAPAPLPGLRAEAL